MVLLQLLENPSWSGRVPPELVSPRLLDGKGENIGLWLVVMVAQATIGGGFLPVAVLPLLLGPSNYMRVTINYVEGFQDDVRAQREWSRFVKMERLCSGYFFKKFSG